MVRTTACKEATTSAAMTFHDSQDRSDLTIDKAIEAAKQSNATLVASLLGCKRSLASGLDQPLHQSTKLAATLLDRSSDLHGWRTLLLVPASYDTPWRAACKIVEESYASRDNWTGLAEIQTFLQETFSSWWKCEREAKVIHQGVSIQLDVVPRELVLKLADTVLKPLLETDSNLCDQRRHWFASLDVITTIVSLSRELEGGDLVEFDSTVAGTVLRKVFNSGIRDDCLLPWLSMASDLKPLLRPCDWNSLQLKVESALTIVPCKVPLSDLPGIGRSIALFLSNCDDGGDELFIRWRQLLPKVIAAASKDIPTYSTVEAMLRSSLSSFSTHDLHTWWNSLRSADCEHWVAANIHLLFLHASQHSGSRLVSALLSQALVKNGVDDLDLAPKCWDSLVRLQISDRQVVANIDYEKTILEVQELLRDIYYHGEGVFKRLNGTPEKNLSTSVICESIFLGDTKLQKRSHRLHATERGQLWVNAANQVLQRQGENLSASNGSTNEDVLMAVLVMVTIFCEIPESRSSLLRTSIQRLIGDHSEATLHCITIKMIVQSFCQNGQELDMQVEDFNQFADAFVQRLDERVCFDLATALCPLCTMRSSMLSIARKLFNTPIVWWMKDATRVAQEGYEKIKCALFILSCLMNYHDTDGLEARILISDMIVLNKPALPLSVRSWFFKLLTCRVKKFELSVSTIGCLYRACLARTLYFFDDRANGILFVPSRVFVAWGSAPVRSSQQESLSDLLLVILAIVGHAKELILNKHTTLYCDFVDEVLSGLSSLLVDSVGTTYLDRCFDWDDIENSHTNTKVTCACLLAIYRACVCSSQGIKTPSVKFTRVLGKESHLRIWRSRIVDEERAQYQKYCTFPQWASIEPDEEEIRTCDVNKQEIDLVFQSLCNLFLDLILSPLWDSLAGAARTHNAAHACSFVVMIKRAFNTSQLSITNDDWVDGTTMPHTIPKFIKISYLLFQSLLHEKRSIEEIECVLTAILDNCLLLACGFKSRRLNLTRDNLVEILDSVLGLYRSLGNEDNTIKLIAYLDEKCLNDANYTCTDGLLRKICTCDDVNEAIRFIRCSILDLLVSCLQRFNDLTFVLVTSTEIEIGIYRMFCSDLRQGLEGLSGGMTDRMYVRFLDCIELSSSILSRIHNDSETVADSNYELSASKQEGAILYDILITFPVRNRTLFKKTLQLAMNGLHFLTHSIKWKDPTADVYKSFDLAVVVMQQCLPLLEKLKTSDTSKSWAVMAGPDHVSLDIDYHAIELDDSSIDSEPPVQTIPAVIAISRWKGTDHYSKQKSPRKLQLPTKQHLYWAFDTAVASMELTCDETLAVMRDSLHQSHVSDVQTISRGKFLHATVAFVVALLKPNIGVDSSLASALPKSSTLKLCSLLAKIFNTLQRSCQIILEYLEKGLPSQTFIALTLLVSWWKGSTKSDNDLLNLTRDWMDHAREKVHGTKESRNQQDESVISRVQRITLKMDEVETTLEKLTFLLHQRHSKVVIRISTLDDALTAVGDSDLKGAVTMNQLVYHLIDRMNTGRFASSESVEGTVSRRPSVLKKRKRNVGHLRSRNKVVDNWLHLDRALDDSDDDAYVDLEDFLADG